MVERVPLLRPAGTTTEEDPPGVVDLAQTSTELFEVWALVQSPATAAAVEQLPFAAIAVSFEAIGKASPRTKDEVSSNFGQTTLHYFQF